ncbi:MAG: DnaD domain protein [Oscillospiraceae bacterium]
MEDKKYRLSGDMSLAVPVEDADRLISLGDGSAALLYLYALRAGGTISPQRAAAALRRTEPEIERAAGLLKTKGLLSSESSRFTPPPAEELPDYSAEDIVTRTTESSEFKAIVEETQRIMGHMLSSADLKILFGIYDYLALPVEVIFILINHCVEETHERLGPGKLPSMRSIEKEAYVWHNREILTLERAEQFLIKKRERSGEMADLKRLLQINGRTFSASESKYVESWLEMGFALEAIAIAYDKTVLKTGGMQWKYMDSILASWHSKGLHTAEEVERGDVRAPSKSAGGAQSYAKPAVPAGSRGVDEAERMKRILDKVKNG